MNYSVQSNIPKLYIIKIAKWFMLFMPFMIPFYQDNGLDLSQISLLKAIYSISIVVIEIPSGYLADILGRKKTLIIGSVLGFAGFFTYSISYGFLGFLIAEIILGIGQSLISGADSAMLYDTLDDAGRKDEYVKYEGRIISIGNLSETIAGVIGGLLIAISLRFPYIVQTGIAFIAIPAALSLTEPIRNTKILNKGFNHILQIVRYSLYDNIELRWNIIYSSIIGAATLTMAVLVVQPFLLQVELPLFYFGIIWPALNLTVAIIALYAYKIELKLNKTKSLVLITFFIPLGYIALSQTITLWGIVILFIFYIIRGFATPVLKDYINQLCDSNIRATVLSVRNFVIRIFFAIIGPFVGWYTDKFSLSAALLISGIIFLLLASFTLIMQLNVIKTNN
ncbi:MAG: MFS transporter [Bacteroidales bacterium]|jgi:MFS family permease|nr:MFS transporter [Bacteroidales bacterium]